MNASVAASTPGSGPLSASERAYQYVKGEILRRRFAAHDLLSEGRIAAAVGVSRTPVREALLRLQGEGLLRLLPKRGALVLPVTADEATDVMETRHVIESFAVLKMAREQRRLALLPTLDSHLADMRTAMAADDLTAYVAADRAFHLAIVAATGNEIITSLYRSLRERQLRMGLVNFLDETGGRIDPDRMQSTLTEHAQIRDAISRGDAAAAAEAVGAHLEHTARTSS